MTPVTKVLVANTMEAAERVRWQEFGKDRVGRRKRKFENLFKVKPGSSAVGGTSRGMDQIVSFLLAFPNSEGFSELTIVYDAARDQPESIDQTQRSERRRLGSSDCD